MCARVCVCMCVCVCTCVRVCVCVCVCVCVWGGGGAYTMCILMWKKVGGAPCPACPEGNIKPLKPHPLGEII